MEGNQPAQQDPGLHGRERRIAQLEEARRSLEETALVTSRIQSDTRRLAELKELSELHTRWLVDLDRKLDRIADLILKGQGGNGHA